MFEVEITKDRWEELLDCIGSVIIDGGIHDVDWVWEFTEDERMLAINTLKNNTPFEVVDCLCGEDEDENC